MLLLTTHIGFKKVAHIHVVTITVYQCRTVICSFYVLYVRTTLQSVGLFTI